MENQSSESNVVSLFGAKGAAVKKKALKNDESTDENVDLMLNDAIRKNEENRKRLMEDRLKANRSVLKSYRINKKS